jgi:hypothetical protein
MKNNAFVTLSFFFKKQMTALGVGMLLLMGLQTQAAVYYVKPTATGAGTGASWADASNDLQGMINASAAGDQVWVAAGTYLPTLDISGLVPTDNRTKTFLMQSGVSVYGGFAGTETALSQRNWSTHPTILSGDLGTLNDNADNTYHVVVVNAPTAPTNLDGFTIMGGYASSNSIFLTTAGGNQNGGGIYTYGGGTNLTLRNLSIVNNYAVNWGGGIFNNATASPTITNVVIVGNSSSNFGGGICNYGSSPTILNTTIANNTTTNPGGGMANLFSSNAVIKNCIVWGNTSGGIISALNNIVSTPIVTYSDVQQSSGVFTGTGNINANPIFFSSNPIGPDGIWMTADDGVQLGCGSPCINMGNNTNAPTTDILGNSIFATTRDMGAYENQGTLGIPLPIVATTQSFCSSNTVANLVATGAGTINWYTTPTGGTALASTTPLTTTTYYVSQAVMSCGESDRIAVGVTVLPSVAVVYVDWSIMTSGDGSSWATAFKTLQEGINVPCVVQVWVRAGTYFPTLDINGLVPTDARSKTFLIKSGVGVYGGFAGTETALSQRNWRANQTILSGDLGSSSSTSDNAYHVVVVNAPIAPTNLDGFTITDGNANGSGTFLTNSNGNRNGAGIYTFGGGTNLSLNNLSIVKCSASNNGGAMYNTNNASPTITNVVVVGNSSSSFGGSIYNDLASSPTILNTTVVNNTAVFSGGGIYNSANSNAIIKNCIVWGNTDGAGVSSIVNSASTPIITYSDIQQSSGVYTGTGNINTDPQFFNLNNPKGADGVWMTADDGLQITCASPCSNTGNNTNAPTTDILGNPIYATTRDLGAYENQGNFIALPTVAATQSPCTSATVANLVATGSGTINWYATSTGGSALASTTPLTTTTYYVSQTVACGESNRVAVAVTVFPNVAVVYVDGSKATSGDGLTWATAFKSVQEGINYPCITQVWVKAGTYLPRLDVNGLVPTDARAKTFLMKSGVSVYGGFAGTETTLSQRNWRNNPTVLSGDLGTLSSNTDNAYHVVVVNTPTAATILDGFTVTGGNANGSGLFLTNSNGNSDGGGIYSLGGGTNLSLTNLSIANNNTSSSGGGIFNTGNSSPTITNAVIVGNSSKYGAGVFIQSNLSPTFLNTTIVNNAALFSGGAIYNTQAIDIVITNSIIWGNTEGGTAISSIAGTASSITYSDIQQTSGVYTGTGNINSNPLFQNAATPAGADGVWMTADDGLQLPCNSPCLNKGINTGAPALDILGNAIFTTVKDMGAYESQIVCPVLPIEWLSFTGRHTDKGNLLTWITATEINNKGYQIERAPQPQKGAVPTWEVLGFADAKGNAATYEFTDKAPFGGWGLYRLRQIDNDGKETFSKVISIQNSPSGGRGLKVYPSVSTGILTVETSEMGDYQVFNLLGQQMLTGKTLPSGAGGLDVSALPQGTYILKVGVEQAKFVKQ